MLWIGIPHRKDRKPRIMQLAQDQYIAAWSVPIATGW
jgi:hypothetical protein